MPASFVSAVNDLQRAVDDALSADVVLADLLAGDRVYDTHPDRDTPYPYVVIGDAFENPQAPFGESGSFCILQIHIWTRTTTPAGGYELGKREAMTIWARIAAVLHMQRLDVSGWRSVQGPCRLVTTPPVPGGDVEQRTMHAVVEWRPTVRVA
jgi:hypothetical protein